jgi:cobalt-zinc-cadmium efflux system membrane fusion protein
MSTSGAHDPLDGRLKGRRIEARVLARGLRAVSAPAILSLLVCGCGGRPAEEVETTEKVPVVTKPARRGSIRPEIGATGVVEPQPGADLVVTAPQSARILEMPRAEGDPVRKGDLLVRFEIPSLAAESVAKSSDVDRARARIETAEQASRRVQALFDRGIAARREVEEAQRELSEARAALAEATSARSAAGLLEQRTVVRARFDGIVASRSHNPGDIVESSSSDPILRVIDPDRIQVEASVPVTQLSQLESGGPARVRGPGSSTPEEATVTGRPAAVDPASATAPVRLSFTRATRLAVGTPVEVTIFGEEHRAALLVPASAVVHEEAESFVLVVEEGEKGDGGEAGKVEGKEAAKEGGDEAGAEVGKEGVREGVREGAKRSGIARRRKVVIGVVAGGQAEILSGVTEGEAVVTQGQEALPDGAAVLISP